MTNTVEVIVDGTSYKAEEGSLLIDLLIQEELKVPYFCYHEALGADGNCRMCMVEIVGQKRPQIACDTLIKEGMEVHSKGKKIDSVRTNILELELINHPVDCPTCDQAGECSLQDFYMDYGLHNAKVKIAEKVIHAKHIDLGANVMLDQERCVLCARCTRFTDQVTHSHELGIIGRGDNARVSTMPGRPLSNPYAMNVVDLCPVGALTSKDFKFHQRVWFLSTTEAICQGCATGCNIYIDHNKTKYQDDVVYRFRPRRNDDVNGFFICDVGRLSYKDLEENRQEKITFENDVIEEDLSIEKLQSLINSYTNITIVIDANLYTEEILALVSYAKNIGAKVTVPLEVYEDPTFEDEMLKSTHRAANYHTVLALKLPTELPNKKSLILNFNHPQTFEAETLVCFTTHQRKEAQLVFPIAAYSENSGTLSNKAGHQQFSQKAVHKNNPVPTILEWLERLSP